ncbi:hypothetical protein J1605_000369 [Eschrichtius robustus]|uniref:Uncharacterized protein n=1 Tax=Eschrichtius robustus TaxID=9764 RepID=A0AB34H7U1_ESCRO|nr:hypothetical protein J1605_000369 [Eschrichtius robustus]
MIPKFNYTSHQAHPSGFKELLSGLAAAATPLFSLPHRLAEAAAARPEIAVASGSLSPQPNPRPPLFPPSCFSAPPPPIPDRVSAQHADKGVKADAGHGGSSPSGSFFSFLLLLLPLRIHSSSLPSPLPSSSLQPPGPGQRAEAPPAGNVSEEPPAEPQREAPLPRNRRDAAPDSRRPGLPAAVRTSPRTPRSRHPPPLRPSLPSPAPPKPQIIFGFFSRSFKVT